jgi:hypothetical protein
LTLGFVAGAANEETAHARITLTIVKLFFMAEYQLGMFVWHCLSIVFVAGGTADAMPLTLILLAPAHQTVAVDQ